MSQNAHSPEEIAISYHMFFRPLTDEKSKEFFLYIASSHDGVCVSLGTNAEHAKETYRLLMQGGVTPSTVFDVLEDFGIFHQPCTCLFHETVTLRTSEIMDRTQEREREIPETKMLIC